ncbi:MAG TPA: hypothetical protein PLV04_09385 [Phenylobacterium sp.]|nr:hypothetical protein [Phenylobacterium sp.]HQP19742.1 hypothetical protein [Phenylobacterium sp.]
MTASPFLSGAFMPRWVVGAPPGGLTLRISIPLRPRFTGVLH